MVSYGGNNILAAAKTGEIAAKVDRAPVFLVPQNGHEVGGFLKKGASVRTISDTGEAWKIRYGDTYGYVKKADMKPLVEKTKNQYSVPSASKLKFITTKKTAVYSTDKGKNVQIALLNENMRYPVEKDLKDRYQINFGSRVAFVYKKDVSIDKGIPVLLYHHLLHDEENVNYRNSSTIPVSQFQEEMQWLKKNGYTTISTNQLESYLNKEIQLPAKVVVITFDDGLKSNYQYAYPILKELGFTATNFIITARTTAERTDFDPNRLQYLSQPELEEMQNVYFYEGHTHDLHRMLFYKSLVLVSPRDEVKNDLLLNKQILSANHFAYPYGQYNIDTINLLKEVGFTMAFTTSPGYVNEKTDRYKVNRFSIHPGLSIEEFKKIVEGKK